jgi:hypothetical protein
MPLFDGVDDAVDETEAECECPCPWWIIDVEKDRTERNEIVRSRGFDSVRPLLGVGGSGDEELLLDNGIVTDTGSGE